MDRKILILFIFNLIFLFILFYDSFNGNNQPISIVDCKINDTYLQLVKNLSLNLNQVLQKYGKITCENSKIDVSANGGWCSKISGRNSTLHYTDFQLAKSFSEFLKAKRVASFGDGPGVYKEYITSLNQVKCYDAYDGAPFVQETTNNLVQFLDFSVPIYHLDAYDWVISLEVAEHIPKESESIYIDNLVRHAKEGIILSWAPIGQDGHSHINNRNLDYVINQMNQRGFKHDRDLTNRFQNAAAFHWLKRNINVYLKK